MSEMQHYYPKHLPSLEAAIDSEIEWMENEDSLYDLYKDVCRITPKSLSGFIQAVLYRLTLENRGCVELCEVVKSLGVEGEVDFSCNFTYATNNEDPHDSLHISNVPRIKELNNHVFSTLQKGQDLF